MGLYVFFIYLRERKLYLRGGVGVRALGGVGVRALYDFTAHLLFAHFLDPRGQRGVFLYAFLVTHDPSAQRLFPRSHLVLVILDIIILYYNMIFYFFVITILYKYFI